MESGDYPAFSSLADESWVNTVLTSDDEDINMEEFKKNINNKGDAPLITNLEKLEHELKRIVWKKKYLKTTHPALFEALETATSLQDEMAGIISHFQNILPFTVTRSCLEVMVNEAFQPLSFAEMLKLNKNDNDNVQHREEQTQPTSHAMEQRRLLQFTFYKLPGVLRHELIAALQATFNKPPKEILRGVQPDTRYRDRWLVTFTEAEYKKKIEDDGITVKDIRIMGKRERFQRRRPETVKVYIPNLPLLCDEQALGRFFEPHNVIRVFRRTDRDGIALGGTFIIMKKAQNVDIPLVYEEEGESYHVYFPGSRPRSRPQPPQTSPTTPEAQTDTAEATPVAEAVKESASATPDNDGVAERDSIQPAPVELPEGTTAMETSSEPAVSTESVAGSDCAAREQLTQDPPVETELAAPAQTPDSACAAEITVVFQGDESDEALCVLLEKRTRTLLCNGKTTPQPNREARVEFPNTSVRDEFVKLLAEQTHHSRIGESSSFVVRHAPGIGQELWAEYEGCTSTIRNVGGKAPAPKRKLSAGSEQGKAVKSVRE